MKRWQKPTPCVLAILALLSIAPLRNGLAGGKPLADVLLVQSGSPQADDSGAKNDGRPTRRTGYVKLAVDAPAEATELPASEDASVGGDCECVGADGRPAGNGEDECDTDEGDCDSDEDDCGKDDEDEDYRILKCRWTREHGIAISGWLEQGFTGNPDRPRDRTNGPFEFNDRSNDYQLNQLFLSVEKAIDDADTWALGYRFDLSYGTDFRFQAPVGIDDWGDNLHGLALMQLYGELYAPIGNGVTVQFGLSYNELGYENITATDNIFYSVSYSNILTPNTNTGILFTYDCSDQLSVNLGFDRGWDKWEDNNGNLSVIGGFTRTSKDGKSELSLNFTHGTERDLYDPDGLGGTRTACTVVFTRELTDDLTYVLENNLGRENNAVPGPGGIGRQDADWFGINQYLYCDINDHWRGAVRLEWLRDDEDFVGLGGPGSYYEFTVGATYKPCPRVWIRPEARWDWYSGPATPYDDGTDSNQFTAACDVIVRF